MLFCMVMVTLDWLDVVFPVFSSGGKDLFKRSISVFIAGILDDRDVT